MWLCWVKFVYFISLVLGSNEQLYVFYTGSFRIQSSSKCANYIPKITPLTLRLQNAESRSLDPGIFGFFSIVRQDRLGISHHIFSDTYQILFRKYRRHCLGVLHKITNTWNSLKVRKEFSVLTDVCSLEPACELCMILQRHFHSKLLHMR